MPGRAKARSLKAENTAPTASMGERTMNPLLGGILSGVKHPTNS